MTIDWKVLWEAVKEPLRILVLAFISYLLVYVTGVEPATPWTLGAGLVLRLIDSLLHEMGKAKEAKTGETSALTKGVTRF